MLVFYIVLYSFCFFSSEFLWRNVVLPFSFTSDRNYLRPFKFIFVIVYCAFLSSRHYVVNLSIPVLRGYTCDFRLVLIGCETCETNKNIFGGLSKFPATIVAKRDLFL